MKQRQLSAQYLATYYNGFIYGTSVMWLDFEK